MYIYIYIYILYIYRYICTYPLISCTWIHMYISKYCTYIQIHIYIYIHKNNSIYIYVYLNIYIYMSIYLYINIYIYIHIHVCTIRTPGSLSVKTNRSTARSVCMVFLKKRESDRD